MSTQLKTTPQGTVAASGTAQPASAAYIANLTVSTVAVTNGIATVTFTTAHGITAAGAKVTFWNIGTNTWLSKVTASVSNVNSTTQIEFPTTHANVASGADTGSAIVSPPNRYRVVRIEIDQSAGTNKLYVGDFNVSSTQYAATLTLAGQIAFELAGEGIDPTLIFVDASASSTKYQMSLVY